MKNKKKAKNKYWVSMIIPFCVGVICYMLYISTENKIEKLLILFVFATCIIPFTLQILNMILQMILSNNLPKNNKNSGKNNQNKVQPIGDTNNAEKKQYSPNKSKESDPKYLELRELLKSLSQSKKLKRSGLLTFKNELDYRLGNNRYNYTNFNFTNDMHEIYTKIKSSKLTDQDYDYLLTHLYSDTNIDIQENTN